MERAIAELRIGALELTGRTGERSCDCCDGEGSPVVPFYRYAGQHVQPVTILDGVGAMTSRPGPVPARGGRNGIQSEVQAKELMDPPTTEIESLGNLIERESNDCSQAEHLKLALSLYVASGP
jgi:hypothetical protein